MCHCCCLMANLQVFITIKTLNFKHSEATNKISAGKKETPLFYFFFFFENKNFFSLFSEFNIPQFPNSQIPKFLNFRILRFLKSQNTLIALRLFNRFKERKYFFSLIDIGHFILFFLLISLLCNLSLSMTVNKV